MSDWSAYIRRRLVHLPLQGPRLAEIVQELADHLETAYTEARATGASQEEARKQARSLVDWRLLESELGRVERIPGSSSSVQGGDPSLRESGDRPRRGVDATVSSLRGSAGLEEGWKMGSVARLIQELARARRRLVRDWMFLLAGTITLALGIGATTAIFSVVNALVLRPLPYPESDRLVWLWHSAPGADIESIGVSYGTYLHYRALTRAFEDIAIFHRLEVTVRAEEAADRVPAAIVTPNFFDLLFEGAPTLGRLFREEDGRFGAPRVVLISHAYWQRQFGGDSNVLGRKIDVGGTIGEIVGVLPPSFDYPTRETDLWYPIRMDSARVPLGQFNASGIARLAPGVTLESARSELADLVIRLDEPYPGGADEAIVGRGKLTALIEPLKTHLVGGNLERMLWVLLATVGLVLLISCANLTNLMLVRMEGRRRELSVRSALGAGRRDLVASFLAEPILLSMAGGTLGVALAFLGVEWLVQIGLNSRLLPRIHEIDVKGQVLLFSGCITLATMVAVGLIPLAFDRSSLTSTLKASWRGSTISRDGRRAQDLLVVSQLALALILLVGAGLMTRSFWNLVKTDPGFDPDGVLSFRVVLSGRDFPDRQTAMRFQQELIDQIEVLPGVLAVGAGDCVPLDCQSNVNPLSRADQVLGPDEIPPAVQLRSATPGFFRATRVALLEGREFDRSDNEQPSGAAIVNRTLAERFWPNQSALGKRIFPTIGNDLPWYHVVGVVEDTPREILGEEVQPAAYFPMIWTDTSMTPGPHSLYYIVRTTAPPHSLEPIIRSTLHELSSDVPVTRFRSLKGIVSEASATQRFAMILLSLAALVATVLGAVGIYGVFSYAVSQRRSEIGIRMALGAGSGRVLKLVLVRGVAVTALGLGIGLIASLLLTRFLGSLLFGVQATDVATYAGVSFLLFALSLVACYVPARRAARIDPVKALVAD